MGAMELIAGFIVAALTVAGAWLGFKSERIAVREGGGAQLGTGEKQQTALERVLTTKTLHVGCIIAEPMFRFGDGPDDPTGIYPAILNDIAERNGLRIVYTKIKNNEVFSWLDDRRVDMVAELLLTEQRSHRAMYAAMIHNVAMIAVVKKGQTLIETQADLQKRGVKCAVVRGEIGAELAPAIYHIPEDHLVVLDTYDVPTVFYVVCSAADVAITTTARWRELQGRDPEIAARLEPVFDPLMLVPAGTLLRKGEGDLKLWLEREVAISRASAAVRQVEDDWMEPYDGAIIRF
jgi:hypothetical protein